MCSAHSSRALVRKLVAERMFDGHWLLHACCGKLVGGRACVVVLLDGERQGSEALGG